MVTLATDGWRTTWSSLEHGYGDSNPAELRIRSLWWLSAGSPAIYVVRAAIKWQVEDRATLTDLPFLACSDTPLDGLRWFGDGLWSVLHGGEIVVHDHDAPVLALPEPTVTFDVVRAP